MKRSFQILTLGVLYLLLCSKSCSDREEFDAKREQEEIRQTKDSVIAVLGSDTIKVSALRAFEVEAVQKTADLIDFFNILSDTSLSPEFKDNAKMMINRMFVSGHPAIRYADEDRFGTSEDLPKCSMVTDSVFFTRPLCRINDTLFNGRLVCNFVRSQKMRQSVKACPGNAGIEIIVGKRDKQFGSKTMKIWSVYFSEVDFW
jgi:hypothetical protein